MNLTLQVLKKGNWIQLLQWAGTATLGVNSVAGVMFTRTTYTGQKVNNKRQGNFPSFSSRLLISLYHHLLAGPSMDLPGNTDV